MMAASYQVQPIFHPTMFHAAQGPQFGGPHVQQHYHHAQQPPPSDQAFTHAPSPNHLQQASYQSHGSGVGDAARATGADMVSAHPFAGQKNPYATAPYSQSVPAYSTPAPQHVNPHAAASQQRNHSQYGHSAPANQYTPPQKYPMAAPPLPQTPSNPLADAKQVGYPQPPQSPGTQAREHQRIALLLEINAELLQEISSLQAQGKGGAANPQMLKNNSPLHKMASEEFIQCLRRVQANLGYLAPRSDPSKAPPSNPLPGPALMNSPIQRPSVQEKYAQLKELFPGWYGIQAPASASPRPNGEMHPTNGMDSSNSATSVYA